MKLTALQKKVDQTFPPDNLPQKSDSSCSNQLKRTGLQLTCTVLAATFLLLVFGVMTPCPTFANSSSAPQRFSMNGLITSQHLTLSPTDFPGPVEEFSFLIKDFKINHQGEVNNLNISVRYRYVTNILNADYPDFRPIAKDIKDFLTNYPNDMDYWEILNKKITALVLKKYPSIIEVRSEMQVSPTSLDSYTRSSIVTRRRR